MTNDVKQLVSWLGNHGTMMMNKARGFLQWVVAILAFAVALPFLLIFGMLFDEDDDYFDGWQ